MDPKGMFDRFRVRKEKVRIASFMYMGEHAQGDTQAQSGKTTPHLLWPYSSSFTSKSDFF